MCPELTAKYGAPFAVESALITLWKSPVEAEIARSLPEQKLATTDDLPVHA
jgi:hypothetical protein